jgi:hypothetical protein
MLVALLLGTLLLGGSSRGLWFFGGQTSHQLQKEVAELEPDKSSRKPIDYTLNQIEAQSKRLQSERKELEKEIFAALERHDTPAEQLRNVAVLRQDQRERGPGSARPALRVAQPAVRRAMAEAFPSARGAPRAVTLSRSVSNRPQSRRIAFPLAVAETLKSRRSQGAHPA